MKRVYLLLLLIPLFFLTIFITKVVWLGSSNKRVRLESGIKMWSFGRKIAPKNFGVVLFEVNDISEFSNNPRIFTRSKGGKFDFMCEWEDDKLKIGSVFNIKKLKMYFDIEELTLDGLSPKEMEIFLNEKSVVCLTKYYNQNESSTVFKQKVINNLKILNDDYVSLLKLK